MKTWATFLDFVMPWAPGVQQPMAEFAIRRAAIEFFQDSRCHRADLAAVATVADSATPLTLVLPGATELEIVQIERVRIADGDDLDPVISGSVPASVLNSPGEPTLFYRSGQKSLLSVLPTPDAVYSLLPTVSLRPADDATGVYDDDLATTYAEAIGCGAIGRLLSMPKKPWTDANAALYYAGKAKAAAIDARDEAERGSTRAPARTRSCFGLR